MRRKYSNALTSDGWTPSPSAYMRPSFHCAATTPCSAAYSSERTPFCFWPSRIARAPDLNASNGVKAVVGAAKVVGGGSGRSDGGAVAVEGVVESTGTGARGRGSEVAGSQTAIAQPAF